MRIRITIIGFLIYCLGAFSIQGQETEEEALGTQEVLVVKSYTPSLSDAFKINSSPRSPDSLSSKDKVLDFKIKSIPVVSTFVPNKATPLKLQRRTSSTPYNSLFNGGFGVKSQLFLDVSSVIELDRTQRFGIKIYRDGFGGNLPNRLLTSNQQFSRFGIHHNLRSNDYNANTLLQFVTTKNNYFGLYDREWDNLLIRAIDPEVKRNKFKVRTHWNWYDFVVRGIEFQANLTSDNFNTSEQQLALKADFELELGDGKISAITAVKGLNTVFQEAYFGRGTQEGSMGVGSIDLHWQNTANDFKMKLGAGIAYSSEQEGFSSEILYYPKIDLSYQKKGLVMVPYFTAQGGVKLNSFHSLSSVNPYLAPTTTLKPTFSKYNATLGVRSSLSSILNFNFGLIFDQIENFMLFERLPFDIANNNDAYRLSNAFENKYTHVDLYGFKADIKIDLAKNNFVRFGTQYRYFDTSSNQSLWNLPSLEMNWEGQFKWKDYLTFTFQGSLLGDRIAAYRPIFLTQASENVTYQDESLPMFISSTSHITYKLSNQFDVFVKLKLNSEGVHGRWAYYNEPSFLLLAGVTYKFDFQY
ncbi:MAG: hypothetical protein P8I42_06060 [Flavobacteriaceae bacterium]|nr:hypothetical protein [Flavobacteriaceae bacterium]